MHLAETPSIPVLGSRTHRAFVITAAVLLTAAFGPALVDLVAYWLEFPEYSHGFLMPVVAGWLIASRRAEIAALRPTPSLFGPLLLLPCLLALLVGETTLFMWMRPFAFVGGLAALVLSFYGWQGVRLAVPALIVLILMCPLPDLIQHRITYPLKNTAAVLATGLLDVTGIAATLDGNLISLPGAGKLWIADACSGIRSLISLVSLAVVACLVWRRHWGLRLLVVLASVPIAVFVNGLRVWLTGFLSVHVSEGAAEGFFHFFEGVVMFVASGLLLLGFAVMLGRLVPRSAS